MGCPFVEGSSTSIHRSMDNEGRYLPARHSDTQVSKAESIIRIMVRRSCVRSRLIFNICVLCAICAIDMSRVKRVEKKGKRKQVN